MNFTLALISEYPRIPSAVDEVVDISDNSLTQGLAIAAVVVSLLAVIVPAATGRQQRRRDDRAKRSEMYLELMVLIERHGLWVADRTYDLTETWDVDYATGMPHRGTSAPERTLRVRARAIVSAYGSSAVTNAYSRWQEALEAFERTLDEFSFTAREEGPEVIDVHEATPLRDSETRAREQLADVVNKQLVRERRWRRNRKNNYRATAVICASSTRRQSEILY
ncbi:hypothetical protein [Clavibacter michiganensis]|uniref:hypothetical protein n=1 Tax=Clavibacter michiganensis TaxID=28447 RepID=UPI00142F9685|nr:hypothetical protein [Clavibacter michiganensis]QIT12711.1 hypothetical protein GRD74_15120 [Clavibacter michiganensis subsp. michiganensis]